MTFFISNILHSTVVEVHVVVHVIITLTNVYTMLKSGDSDRHITHLGDLYIFFPIKYIFKISFTFRLSLTITQKIYQYH
jgi:hypothetical protein